jgi:hypothetical protein
MFVGTLIMYPARNSSKQIRPRGIGMVKLAPGSAKVYIEIRFAPHITIELA